MDNNQVEGKKRITFTHTHTHNSTDAYTKKKEEEEEEEKWKIDIKSGDIQFRLVWKKKRERKETGIDRSMVGLVVWQLRRRRLTPLFAI
jgi:hypothetical protein